MIRPTSISAAILEAIGEQGAGLEEVRAFTQANPRSVANRISELKYEGFVVTKYELTEAGKRLLRQLNKND